MNKLPLFTIQDLTPYFRMPYWVDFSYDGAGHLEWVDCSNGAVAEYTHDSFGQLTGVTIRDSSDTVIASYEHSLDENGMRTGATMSDGSPSYTLDSLNRLTREDVDSASLQKCKNVQKWGQAIGAKMWKMGSGNGNKKLAEWSFCVNSPSWLANLASISLVPFIM
ncbi:MAG: hypothetical protein BA871_00750 [Desulfuromonadales bacterium C00003096]|nr:MAG: hypothetical protein BA871_00750 [Desulfuromonadales bacterium C00003096]